MRLSVFEEATFNMTILVATEKEGLIFSSLFVFFVELVNDFLSASKNFGALKGRMFDWKLLVGTAGVDGEVDFLGGMVPIEGIFHFIAVEIIVAIGNNFGGFKVDFFFAEGFDDEFGFEAVLGGEVKDLPRGSREKMVVFWLNTVFRGNLDFGGDCLEVRGFSFGDFILFNKFTRQGIPEENFFAIFVSRKAATARNDFFNFQHGNIITQIWGKSLLLGERVL